MKVTIVLGLCGSGKSYYCRKLCTETGAHFFEHVASQPETRARLLAHLRGGHDATVEEVTYCDPSRRSEIEAELAAIKGLEIVYVCFENVRKKADSNVVNRMDKHGGGSVEEHLRYNRELARVYRYPEGARVLPIFVIPSRDAG